MTEHTRQEDRNDTEQLTGGYSQHEYPPADGGSDPGVTHRYGDSSGFTPSSERASSRPSKAAIAAILVAALVVGGLSGLAGAAGFAVLDDLGEGDAATASPSLGNHETQVSESRDTLPERGSVEQVAASVLPSVVKITVTAPSGTTGSGSGIILSEDGTILTNNHVVAVAEQGGRISVHFADGSAARAEIVGTDPLTDLAVIQAQDVNGLSPAKIGQSGQLDVGEQVVAVGSPFGLEATVTSGIVSAKHRPVSVPDSTGTDTTYPAIQTDAAINPGNSGGPLVNMRGEVVGINSSIRTSSSSVGQGGSIGLGFAIPIDNVLPIVDQLRNGQRPTHARLGVSVVDATSSDGLQSGAGVRRVVEGSPADEAGLERSDVIVAVDDVETTSAHALVATVRGHRPGDDVTLTVVKDGDERETIGVTLTSDAGAGSA